MNNRGMLLEDFSESLLGSISGFIVKYKRTRAQTYERKAENEYDLIIHNTSSLFPEFGNYILVECKDWKNRVGYPQIAKFLHTLHSRGCKTGILIALRNVTHKRHNLTLHRAYDQDGIAVIVIDETDITNVLDGTINLSSLVRRKYEKIKFGIK